MWDWGFTVSILPDLLEGLWVTVQAVFFGMLLALVVGLFWTICRRSGTRWIEWAAGGFVEFVRSTPILIQLFFLYNIAPGSITPFWIGTIALGVHYSCYTSEVYRAGISGIARGQWEAARALNLGRVQTYHHVILPQAIPPVIPALGNYLIAMFKDTPLLSAITVLEVLRQAQIIVKTQFRDVEPYTMVAVLYLVLSLISGLGVRALERRMKVEKA